MRILRLLALTGLLFGVPHPGLAERLPVTVYSAMDGLGSSSVTCVRRDSRGFMWFCTTDGLSRFDGTSFVTYSVADGLPHPAINDLVEQPAGVYWVATNGGGVCRFDAGRKRETSSGTGADMSRMTVYRIAEHGASNRVNALLRDRHGRIWAGTDRGLFYLDDHRGERIFRPAGAESGPMQDAEVRSLLEDRHGQIWVAAHHGLFGIRPDGEVIAYGAWIPSANRFVNALLADRHGRLWIGSGAGVTTLTPTQDGCKRAMQRRLVAGEGSACSVRVLSGDVVSALYEHSDQNIWMTGQGSLTQFDGRTFRRYTERHGLVAHLLRALGEDGAGSLWVGTDNGLLRIAHSGFVGFDRVDGVDAPPVEALFETNAGELCLALNGSSRIACRTGDRFETTAINLPGATGRAWGSRQTAFQDRRGEWWIPSANGLYRFPAGRVETLRRARPGAVYTIDDGLADNLIFRLFEDSRGDIWIGTISENRDSLHRWERTTGRIRRFTDADGIPARDAPTGFAEDQAGNVWIGLYNGGLLRYRDGRFTPFTSADGVPPGMVRTLLIDHAGRLWIATSAGSLSRADRPDDARPRFVRPDGIDRLGGRAIYCLVEDRAGRLYAGSARGLYRIDPRTGEFRHYTRADGLADVGIFEAFRDRGGALWFGTHAAVFRFLPEQREPAEAHEVFVGAVNIAGELVLVSELGEKTMALPELAPNRNQIEIAFFGLAFGVGRSPRYQYRLDGWDQGWSPPTTQRVVNYAGLAPGRYTFMVRPASDSPGDGRAASVAFRIRPPMWHRWWFITACGAAAATLIVSVHRHRLARVVEIERVRTRIATDLHDDIGSNLSKIALMCGVTAQQVAPGAPDLAARLSSIAGISQESVDAMSDIVWAIDPHKDRLHDLVRRMRRFASDAFTASGTAFRFTAPVENDDLALGADVRREVFLIFKEAVNNVLRHAGCTTARIEMRADVGSLTLTIADDGRGFHPEQPKDGNGLASMRRRASALGGRLDVASSPGKGTRITLHMPLRRTYIGV